MIGNFSKLLYPFKEGRYFCQQLEHQLPESIWEMVFALLKYHQNLVLGRLRARKPHLMPAAQPRVSSSWASAQIDIKSPQVLLIPFFSIIDTLSQCLGENLCPGASRFGLVRSREDSALNSNTVKELEIEFLQLRLFLRRSEMTLRALVSVIKRIPWLCGALGSHGFSSMSLIWTQRLEIG